MTVFTAEHLEKARATRAANAALKPHLKIDFMDDPVWLDMARARHVQLPGWGMECTKSRMLRWMHRLGVSYAYFRYWTCFQRLEQWIAANPAWGLHPFVGLLLEELEYHPESVANHADKTAQKALGVSA